MIFDFNTWYCPSNFLSFWNRAVKNIPHELYKKFKIVANVNHRSINNEMINCLESVLMPQRLTVNEKLSSAKQIRDKIDIGKIDAHEIKKAIEEGRL